LLNTASDADPPTAKPRIDKTPMSATKVKERMVAQKASFEKELGASGATGARNKAKQTNQKKNKGTKMDRNYSLA
jgi:hypothetical protein